MASWMTYIYCSACATKLEMRFVERRELPVCPGCERIQYLDPKVAAGTIPRMDGGLVLIRRGIEPGYGLWTFPGGYMDLGETCQETAIRETHEETGLSVEIDSLLGVYSFPGRPVVVVVYSAVVVEGVPAPLHECLEARVFQPDEVPWEELAFPSTRAALTDAISRWACPS